MEVGIIGLPSVGKTTLFTALTGADVDHYSERPHVGMAPMPDPRLETIAGFITTKKIIPATIKLVDIHGVAPGGDKRKLNSFLEHLRQVDALCHVVRCFDNGEPPRPGRDVETLDTELVLADLVVVESALDKARRTARTGDTDAKARVAVLERVQAVLEEGMPIRSVEGWPEADERILKSYGMVTARPVLYVANVAEDDVDGGSEAARAVAELAAAAEGQFVAVCAKLEAELAELDEADRDEMLGSMGLSEPAIGPLARAANKLLGLTTFYTAGDKEVRAWTITLGATAPDGAGVIHSDIQRGFIRAECYSVDDLVQHKTEKAIREAGKMRSEGKSYQMQDGDVVHFLFNV